MMTDASLVSQVRRIRRSSRQPTSTASAAAVHSPRVAPIPTASGSWKRAARVTVVSCVRSPNSAKNTTANDVHATGQNASRTPSRPVSSSSSSPLCLHSSTAPTPNATAVAAYTQRWGSMAITPPTATASTTCTANAAAAPVNTELARYRLLRMRHARMVLSGSSAGRVVAKLASVAVTLMRGLRSVGSGRASCVPDDPGPSARQREVSSRTR